MSETITDPRLKICAGPCGRMTRHKKMAAKDFPGTVIRVDSTRCDSCWVTMKESRGEPVSRASKRRKVKQETKAGSVEAAFRAAAVFADQRQARMIRSRGTFRTPQSHRSAAWVNGVGV